MGLISRVSSRTYRTKSRKIPNDSIMSLSPEIQKALKDAFDLFDEDKTSELSNASFAKALQKKFNIKDPAPIVKKIKAIDTDGSGSIDFQEFVACLRPYLCANASEAGIWKTFCEFDKDGNGYIEPEELQEKLEEMYKQKFTLDQIKGMIAQVDVNGDGMIDFEEFKELMGYKTVKVEEQAQEKSSSSNKKAKKASSGPKKQNQLSGASQSLVWSICRQNHAYLVKSRKNGGVQFSKHPNNLKNKNTLKYSGLAAGQAVSVQAAGKKLLVKLANQPVAEFDLKRGSRPIVNKIGNAIGRYNPALKTVAKRRATALIRSNK